MAIRYQALSPAQPSIKPAIPTRLKQEAQAYRERKELPLSTNAMHCEDLGNGGRFSPMTAACFDENGSVVCRKCEDLASLDDPFESDDEADEDLLGDAAEVLKPADYPGSVLPPPSFSGHRRIGGARRFVGLSSTALDGEGKLARYKIGDAVRIQGLQGDWIRAVVTKVDVRKFMENRVWHYKLKNEDGKVDSEHWYPQALLSPA